MMCSGRIILIRVGRAVIDMLSLEYNNVIIHGKKKVFEVNPDILNSLTFSVFNSCCYKMRSYIVLETWFSIFTLLFIVFSRDHLP